MFSLLLYILITSLIVVIIRRFLHQKKEKLSKINKCILITGCDTGIGHETALRLHQNGFFVIATCLNLNSVGAVKLISSQINGIDSDGNTVKNKLFVIELDVTKKESIANCKKKVEDILINNNIEGLWSLINNAGVCVFGEFDWLTVNQIEKQINVNVVGTILMTKTFLPLIKKAEDGQQSGRIIIIGSVNGFCSYPGLSAYCASKFALEGFSQVLRSEVSKLGIKVILIRPGDFAKLTNIMSSHKKEAEEMWSSLTEDDKKFYGKYFEAYHGHIIKNAGMTSPPSFESSTLFNDIEESLIAVNPSNEVTVAPTGFKVFFKLLSMLPLSVKDKLIDMLYVYIFKFDSRKYLKSNSR